MHAYTWHLCCHGENIEADSIHEADDTSLCSLVGHTKRAIDSLRKIDIAREKFEWLGRGRVYPQEGVWPATPDCK